MNPPIRGDNKVGQFRSIAMSSIGIELVIIAGILALALYLREVFPFLNINSKRIRNSLNMLIIPLLIVFVALVIIIFSQ